MTKQQTNYYQSNQMDKNCKKEIIRKEKQDKFIKKAKEIWGDVYGYTKVRYEHSKKKVSIYCNSCKVYRGISPDNHTKKTKPRGCKVCGRKRQILKATKPFSVFLKDANKVHNFKYQYDESTYLNAKTLMTIICSDPKHKPFPQTPDAHINGGQGCPSCNEVDEDKLRAEAKIKGLIYLKKGKSKDYKEYQFISCGHKQEMQPTNIRNSEVNCQACKDEKYKLEAQKHNLTFLGEGRNSSYKNYRFNNCGHTRDILPSSIRKYTAICIQCIKDEKFNSIEKLGLEYIGKSSDGDTNKVRVRFNSCKHERDMYSSSIKSGFARCDICYDKKFINEADEAGLILIGSGKDGNYRTYTFKRCDHQQEIQLIHVREKSFKCNTCNESSRDLPSNVYLLKITILNESWIKLGFAKNVVHRLSTYGLPQDAEVDIIKTISFDTGKSAHKFENSLKNKYSNFNLSPEKMIKYHKFSGHTECFKNEILSKLIDDLSEFEARE
ncbi:hypothetical protein N9512_04160 [Amylibacter sp.]|nr:hypothetical protein [Amylibacter sp.]